jgi:two-component system, LuxR family, response regulator FixJ
MRGTVFMSEKRIVHIIDDDRPLLHSMSMLMEAMGYECSSYESAEAFLEKADGELGGCVVSDICMPGMSGMDLMLRLRRRKQAVPVVLVTGHADVKLAVEAMKAGAFDFLPKPFDPDTLVDTVRQAFQSSRVAVETIAPGQTALVSHLTRREVEVLTGLARGAPSKVIAHDLNVSIRTVEAYRSKLLLKLNVRSTVELMRIALKAGLDSVASASHAC